ncbi:hypothetical protein MPL3365_150204 [Mesorhizobium plurifarium]|uniref:Uncharacterized protein n=1 Tax=Mesorhizobium plurifarium TaxID=69974 RepID=A0A090FYP1_MESPL|nr:hypothetical protein MPL3365_150204 [Mesorhizobium plurifarium]
MAPELRLRGSWFYCLVGTPPHPGRFERRELTLARPLVEQDPADQPGQHDGRDGIGGGDEQGMRAHSDPSLLLVMSTVPIMSSLNPSATALQFAAVPQ